MLGASRAPVNAAAIGLCADGGKAAKPPTKRYARRTPTALDMSGPVT